MALWRLLILLLATIAAAPSAAMAEPFSGPAQAIDGDSLMVGDEEVRLFGIDAPELSQHCTRTQKRWPCGSVAADQLGKMIAGKHVECSSTGRDRHGRTLARCRAGDTDLNRYMVASGHAVAYRRYPFDYIAAEDSAKANKRGIWSGTFELPSEVRQTGEDYRIEKGSISPLTRKTTAAASSPKPRSVGPRPRLGCVIKGNHSRKGEWIYHLPGMPYYAQTRAEAMFCSEAEAVAAGYRRSRADQHR